VKNLSLYAAKFLVTGYTGILAPLLPLLLSDKKLSLTQAGALVSFFALFNSLLQPLCGSLQGRIGYAHSLCLTPLWVGLFMGLTGLAPDFGSLLACLLLAGIGISAFHPASFSALAGRQTGEDGSMRISFLLLAASLGFVLAPSCIAFFVSRFGLERLYLICVPGAAATLALFPFLRRNKTGPLRAAGRPSHPLRVILPEISPFFLFALTLTIAAMNLYSLLPLLLKEKGAPLEMIGFAMSSLALGCAVGPLGGSLAAKRFGRKPTLVLSVLSSAVLLTLFLPAQNIPVAAWSILFLFLLGAALTLPSSVLIEMAQEAFPHHIGAVSSLLSGFAWGCGGVLVVFFAGVAEVIGVGRVIGGLVLLPLINLGLIFGVRSFRCGRAANTIGNLTS
jgi:MFS transporter, FSR family, fosmidomycin resistance protein